jgi:hypothetical protein
MNRCTLTLVLALTALLLPASALAAPGSGIVLSVDRSDHAVQVVDAGHFVHDYHYGKIPKVATGSRVRFKISGKNITAVRKLGKASAVSFFAKVVRSGTHVLVLRLADGSTLALGARQLAQAKVTMPAAKSKAHVTADTSRVGRVVINVAGLRAGETVLVTESTNKRNLVVTIELIGTPGGVKVSELQLSGVVTDLERNTFEVTTADGSVISLRMAPAILANLNLNYCDEVTVAYHVDGGAFIADTVVDTGPSTTGMCANNPGSGPAGGNAIGTITSVSDSSITIDQGAGQGPLTFTVDDPSITAGFVVGDGVDVTYTQDSDGTLDANNVQYVEDDAIGAVTAVSAGSVTITNASTGTPDTFVADPTIDMFDGVEVGDEVDISYHLGAGQNVADSVDDFGPGELGAAGAVTAVGAGSMTITDSLTGHADTFVADPTADMFDGVAIGDQVNVIYHLADGQNVADNVDDNGPEN